MNRLLPLCVLALWIVLFMGSISAEVSGGEPAPTQISKQDELYDVAQKYRLGVDGVERDVARAISLLKEIGAHKQALYDLGQIYEDDELEMGRNLSRAVAYYNESAALGYAPAMTALGFHYSHGVALPQNKPLALLYFTFAAQAGDPDALMALGYSYLRQYRHGRDTGSTCEFAMHAYQRVAKQVIDEDEFTGIQLAGVHVRLQEHWASGRDRVAEENDVVQYFKYNADTGDQNAQVTMATLYLEGYKVHDIEKDDNLAQHYFHLAALDGDTSAIAYLGYMHLKGRGTLPQNNKTALEFFKRAADRGNIIAMVHLGNMHLKGIGTPQNFEKAFKYFKQAADAGSAEGTTNLGHMLLHGWGMKPDHQKALAYYQAAAKAGHLYATYQFARMNDAALGGLKRSCSTAAMLFKRVAEASPDYNAQIRYAYRLYEAGDYEGALLKYERLALMGFEIAQANTAWLYDYRFAAEEERAKETAAQKAADAVGSPSDDSAPLVQAKPASPSAREKALFFYTLAAEQSNADANLRLGDFYYYGYAGLKPDLAKAVSYYRTASDLNNAQATFNLGYMHQFGMGVPKDLHLAKRFYELAVEKNPDANVPRLLALAGLGIHYAYDWLTSAPPLLSSPTAQETEETTADKDDGFEDILLPGLSNDGRYHRKNTYKIMGLAWDNALLMALFCCLIGLMYLRRQRFGGVAQQQPLGAAPVAQAPPAAPQQ